MEIQLPMIASGRVSLLFQTSWMASRKCICRCGGEGKFVLPLPGAAGMREFVDGATAPPLELVLPGIEAYAASRNFELVSRMRE